MREVDTTKDQYLRIYRKTMDDFICFMAHWELTYKCNLGCRHCYAAGAKGRQEFSYEKARSVIDELKNMGCLYLTLSGGEVLMRDDFFDIASYAREQGFALRLMTNATLVDETVSGKIASLHPLAVETSIYAADKGLHDAITFSPGSFDKTIKAATLLREKNIKVVLKFLIMNDNIEEFRAVESLAGEIGADFVFDYCVVGRNDGSKGPLKYRLNEEKIKDFFVSNSIPLKKREADGDALLCIAGFNNIFITPHLDVYPCIGLNVKLGNLHEEKLGDIWRSSEGLKFVRNIKLPDLPECKRCGLVQFCFRCSGIALSEDGDIFGPSNFDCSVAKAIGEIVAERKELINDER
ncbi:MAG: radical SAM protein [Candidatus Omnitrophica bacterium]|nr:radical SAM protein [Candidatus Omnitrophota bacterium]